MRFINKYPLIILSLCLGGCASTQDGSRQTLLISNHYAGSRILLNGKEVGVAPHFIQVDRSPKPKIELATSKGKVELPVRKVYRWSGSFARNLMLLSMAPIGWVTDLVTGAAYKIEIEKAEGIEAQAIKQNITKKKVVAIAPPQASTSLISETAARALEEELKASRPNEVVLPVSDTQKVFVAYGYDFDEAIPVGERNELYLDLGADAIYESKVTANGLKLELSSRLVNVFDYQSENGPSLEMNPVGDIQNIMVKNNFWTGFIPNSVGLDLSGSSIAFQTASREYKFRNLDREQKWWKQGLDLVSSVYIGNIPELRKGRRPRWIFKFSPQILGSYKEVRAPDEISLSEDEKKTEYRRTRVFGGWGPEAGYEFGKHYLFMSFIPGAGYTSLSWSGPAREGSVENFEFSASVEIGYLYAYDPNWTVKIFARSLGEDPTVWKEALAGTPLENGSSLLSSTAGGIAVAYRFSPKFSALKWKKSN